MDMLNITIYNCILKVLNQNKTCLIFSDILNLYLYYNQGGTSTDRGMREI